MKKLLAITLMMSLSLGVMAQKKVKKRDIIGEWQLRIDIDREEIEEEIEEEENWLARSLARSVSSFALDVVENIDVEFDFRSNGEVRVEVYVLGKREVDYLEWYITREGELIIESDSGDENLHIDGVDVFMWDRGNLVAYEKRGRGKYYERQEVYLERKEQ